MKSFVYCSIIVLMTITLLLIMLPSCTSILSCMSVGSLMSGRTMKLCPAEKNEIINEAVNKTLLILNEDNNDEKENN